MLEILCQSNKIILRIDIDGILAPLVKQLVEAVLEAELDSHITQDVFSGNKNRKNGKTSKTIKSTSGTFELSTPRDRAGSFEPQIVKKNQKEFMRDLKLVYQATTKELAKDELLKWGGGKKYPIVLQSWQNKWENLSYCFKYPKEIRKIMYTTNIIESVHRQFRKLTT